MKKGLLATAGLVMLLAACGDEESTDVVEDVETEEVAAEEGEEEAPATDAAAALAKYIDGMNAWTSYRFTEEWRQVPRDGTEDLEIEVAAAYMADPASVYQESSMGSGEQKMKDAGYSVDGVTYMKDESGKWVDANADATEDDVTIELDVTSRTGSLGDLVQAFVDTSTKIEELDQEYVFTVKPANAQLVLNALFQHLYGTDYEMDLANAEEIKGQVFHDGEQIVSVQLEGAVDLGSGVNDVFFTTQYSDVNALTDIAPEDFEQ